jgi:hypothetical protein
MCYRIFYSWWILLFTMVYMILPKCFLHIWGVRDLFSFNYCSKCHLQFNHNLLRETFKQLVTFNILNEGRNIETSRTTFA